MPSGFKIASAYVDVTLDRSALPGELEDLAGELSASSDAIGRDAGKRIGDGIGKGVGDAPVAEPATRKGAEAGGRFGDAFSARVGAALKSLPPADISLDDEYAQAKLDFIREELKGLSSQRIGIDVSETDAIAKLTMLRAQLDDLRTISPSIQVKADTAAAAAEIDKFLAATEVKAEVAGKAAGDKLSSGMAQSAQRGSPLIMAAITGALMAGGPAISAAGILLFGGLTAAAESNVGEVQYAFKGLAANVMNDVQGIAENTSGEFVAMAGDIQSGFDQLYPALRAAMIGVAPEIHDVVDALMGAANTAVPAFTRAIQQGQPVVQGLDALVRDLGSGVAGMMDQLTAHSGAEGAVLSELGQTINILLPMIGQLLGEGAELGRDVLPLVNTALHLVAGALQIIGPVLPEVVAGFVAFKAVGALSGPLDLLSAKLQTVAADSEGMASKMAGNGASAVSKMSSALPALTAVLALGAAAWEAYTQQVDQWADALNKGGAAEAQAKAQMSDTVGWTDKYGGSLANVMDKLGMFAGVQQVANAAAGDAKGKADANTQALSPLERAQQDVTKATNDYTLAVQQHGAGSADAAAKADILSSANDRLTGMNNQVKTATEGATTAQEANQQALQSISDKASAANTQIALLKGALDSLTGANMTADQAQIAVTQAVDAATQAVQGHSAALSFTNGQLDLSNAKSASAAQILMSLAGTQHNEIATLEQQGASQADVTAKSDQMRQQFIQVAQQMGATAQQAQDLANRYFGIPGDVHTNITAYDNASPTIQRVQGLIAGLHDKNIFITTYSRVVSSGPAGLGGAAFPQATGGVMLPMAVGGVVAMAAGADVFEPNHPTVLIGDNRKVRESFIPQDDSPRSRAILTETASAMGYGLVPNSDGGTVTSRPVTVNGDVVLSFPNVQTIADAALPRQLLLAIREGVRKLDAADR